MENKIINIIAFAAGAAIGSVVTWKVLKTKYEQIAQKEIDSVKEAFSKEEQTQEETEETNDISVESEVPTEKEAYNSLVGDLGYSNDEEGDETVENKPYVISPDDFGMCEGYDAVSLTYYANGVLMDENDEEMSEYDIESCIGGKEALTHFGEYEDDSVFVRNDEKEIDYEILRRDENYQPESEEYDD